MGLTTGINKKSTLFLDFVRLHFPEDLATIEQEEQEKYFKQRENIQSQIKKFKKNEEENNVA